MAANLKILIAPLVLVTSMACAFVQNMLFPPSPTEVTAPAFEPLYDPEPIGCTNDDCLNVCLDRLNKVLETRPFDPIDNSIYEEQGADFNLVIYKVDGNEIMDPAVLYVPSEYHKYQEDTASHLRIWDFYVAVIPPELRKRVNEFVIFTDGPEDSAAWVSRSTTDVDYWQVGFDLLDSDYPAFLSDSLVHETAHLLTLNTSQIPYDENHFYFYDEQQKNFMPGCEQYAVDGGCSLPNSYINLFYRRFWKENYAAWWKMEQEAQNASSYDEYLERMEQFYDRHSDWFLNSYAATNVEEDMAESFAFFALNARPSGDAIYEQKIAFYYEFPELVEYRQQIIEGLCSYVR